MKKNILLVDDDYVCNFLNQKVLASMGIANTIDTASNGKEALNLLNEYFMGSRAFPDIILLDLSMPVMDGFEFLEAFKKMEMPHKDKISIVIVTSSQDPDDIRRAKEYGIDHYLNKPVSPEDLREALGL